LTAKIQIINAIGNRRDASAISFLKQRLYEIDGQIVESALMALGKIGTKTATETILEFKKQSQPSFINAIDDSLLLCAEKALTEQRRLDSSSIYKEIFNDPVSVHIKRAAFLGLVKTDNDGGAERIESILMGSDTTLKPVAIALIPSIKGANISARFSKLMPSLQPSEQTFLIDALAMRGDKDAIKTIEQLVNSQNNEVKYAAITALGNIGNTKHVKILVKALTEAANPQELRIVEQAISSLKGGKKFDLAIVSELKNASPAGKTRIINVLGRRYATVAVDAILTEAISEDTATSRAAFKVLSRLSSEKHLPQLVDAMIKAKSTETRADAESAVAAIIEKSQDKRICENLVCEQLEKTTDTEIRVSLINLLPVCGGQKALEMAKSAYSSADSKIKEAGIRAISEWQDISVWEILVNIYENAPSESYRVLALRGLTRLLSEENIRPDANLVLKYQQLFNGAKNVNDKKLILGALSGCYHPEALYLALEKINEPEIKSEAVAAVKKIAAAIQQKYPRESSEALQKVK
jgi:HEAT repeat protein